jgi:hypothetical protein
MREQLDSIHSQRKKKNHSGRFTVIAPGKLPELNSRPMGKKILTAKKKYLARMSTG